MSAVKIRKLKGKNISCRKFRSEVNKMAGVLVTVDGNCCWEILECHQSTSAVFDDILEFFKDRELI